MSDPSNSANGSERVRQHRVSASGGVLGRRTLALAVLVMAIPAAIPLVIIIEPTAIPFITPVDPSSSGTYWFLIVLSGALLAVNWTVVFVVWRWLERYAGRSGSAPE